MFGVVRPCRHRLRGSLYREWMAHLCGLCLTLRDLHGQSARLVTNYDGLLVSVLAEAQNPDIAPHRTAGPCALRGFRRADVVDAAATGARLAAAVSLVLAAGKIRDHIEDGDGALARRLVAAGAGLAAGRWQGAGARTGSAVGFDTAVLTDAIGRQSQVERAAGLALPEVTEPAETAVSAAFAHTAALAGQPRNVRPLAEAGRHFGRIAHLLDAVTDLAADREAGAYNPLLATRTTPDQARERCADAVSGLRRAVADLDLQRSALTRSLLVTEVDIAVGRAFRQITRDQPGHRHGTRDDHGTGSGTPVLGCVAIQPGPPLPRAPRPSYPGSHDPSGQHPVSHPPPDQPPRQEYRGDDDSCDPFCTGCCACLDCCSCCCGH